MADIDTIRLAREAYPDNDKIKEIEKEGKFKDIKERIYVLTLLGDYQDRLYYKDLSNIFEKEEK
jgi:hypothetical protein